MSDCKNCIFPHLRGCPVMGSLNNAACLSMYKDINTCTTDQCPTCRWKKYCDENGVTKLVKNVKDGEEMNIRDIEDKKIEDRDASKMVDFVSTLVCDHNAYVEFVEMFKHNPITKPYWDAAYNQGKETDEYGTDELIEKAFKLMEENGGK